MTNERKGPEYEFRQPRRRKWLPAVIGLAILCFSAVAWVYRGKEKALADRTQARLSAVVRALDSVKRAKVTKWSVREGKPILSEIDYYDNGNWRTDRPGFDIRIYTPLCYEQYESRAKIAVLYRATGAPGVSYLRQRGGPFSEYVFGPTPFTNFGMAVTFQPAAGSAYGLLISNPNARTSYQADASSNRILGWQTQERRQDGTWVTTKTGRISYDDPFPDSTCDPMMLPYPKIGIQALHNRWSKLLNGVLARTASARKSLTLHAAFFNSEGELVLVADQPYLGPVVDQYGTPYILVGGTINPQEVGSGYWRFFPATGRLPTLPCTFTAGVSMPALGGLKALAPLKFTVSDRIAGVAPQYFMATEFVFDRLQAEEDKYRRLSGWYAGARKGQADPKPANDLEKATSYLNLALDTDAKDPDMSDLELSYDYAQQAALMAAMGRAKEAAAAQALSEQHKPWPIQPAGSKRVTVDE